MNNFLMQKRYVDGFYFFRETPKAWWRLCEVIDGMLWANWIVEGGGHRPAAAWFNNVCYSGDNNWGGNNEQYGPLDKNHKDVMKAKADHMGRLLVRKPTKQLTNK